MRYIRFELFAIVDIETTGGYAANNAITEVAIVLHNGKQEIKRFEALVNPGMPIPKYIQALTGINDDMVAYAPTFERIAADISELLEDAVFVAHNVNFDYSFLKYQLKSCGYDLKSKKLCTVRLSRKAFPGLSSYSLGSLCRQLNIDIVNRHRAGGDVDATIKLFERIVAGDKVNLVQEMLKSHNPEQYLPPHLNTDALDLLPQLPGIYYFHNEKGKVIYVGKAKNIKKRVTGHFSNNKPNRQKQEFLRNIHAISHQACGTELMAFLMECVEIRRLWPQYNRSLKRFEQMYGLYFFEDMNGYHRLAIEKRKKNLEPLYTFCLFSEGQNLLRKLVAEFGLCPKLCFLTSSEERCLGPNQTGCPCACEQKELALDYNERVKLAVASLRGRLPSFTVIDQGRNLNEKSCILIERGKFYGMGYLPAADQPIGEITQLKAYLTPYPENDYMRGLVYEYTLKWPSKKIDISVQ
ncbi:MAG TPA: exonuclease domain-containing protein [Puia sp.]|nr:exonuclease domain-containing protein [Puia sp.]